MTITGRFTSIERLLAGTRNTDGSWAPGWLENRLGVRCRPEPPDPLEYALPMIVVARIGGPNEGVIDRPMIAVDTFAVDRDSAGDLAEDVRTALFWQLVNAPFLNGAVVTRVTTISGPHYVPYDDKDLRRFTATYGLSVQSRLMAS